MSKYIIVDSREKPKAIQSILDTFDEAGIKHETSKLFVGDYMDWNRPQIVIDRKQNVLELAKNVTTDFTRFRAELERAKDVGTHLVILVEQNRYKDRDRWIHINDISDLMLWSNPHTVIRGERVFRALSSLIAKYNISVKFCDKRSTGREIIRILYGDIK